MSRWDNVTQDELDEMVHDAKSDEAASINNRGRDAQIDFLDDFPHLSSEQKEKIHNEILYSDTSSALASEEHLNSIVSDRWANESIASKIDAISGDPEVTKEILGFDPETGEDAELLREEAEAEQIRDEKRGLYPELADPCN